MVQIRENAWKQWAQQREKAHQSSNKYGLSSCVETELHIGLP